MGSSVPGVRFLFVKSMWGVDVNQRSACFWCITVSLRMKYVKSKIVYNSFVRAFVCLLWKMFRKYLSARAAREKKRVCACACCLVVAYGGKQNAH